MPSRSGVRAACFGLALSGGMTPCPVHAQESSPAGSAVLVTAGLVFLGSTIFDVATAPSSARRTNRAVGLSPTADWRRRTVGFRVSVPLGDSQATPRDPSRALTYSLVGAVVPLAATAVLPQVEEDTRRWLGAGIGVAGIVGPSAGHWYAGQDGRALRGVAIRVLAIVAGLAVAGSVFVD